MPSDYCALCSDPLVPITRGSAQAMPIWWCPNCDLPPLVEPSRPPRERWTLNLDGEWIEGW